jgi:hypothetical protein
LPVTSLVLDPAGFIVWPGGVADFARRFPAVKPFRVFAGNIRRNTDPRMKVFGP